MTPDLLDVIVAGIRAVPVLYASIGIDHQPLDELGMAREGAEEAGN